MMAQRRMLPLKGGLLRLRVLLLFFVAAIATVACGGGSDQADQGAFGDLRCAGSWLRCVNSSSPYLRQNPPATYQEYNRAMAGAGFVLPTVEPVSDPPALDQCVVSRGALTMCRFQFASSVPCSGPPLTASDFAGVFSPEVAIAMQIEEGDRSGAGIDFFCELKRRTEDEVNRRANGIEGDEDDLKWLEDLTRRPDFIQWAESDSPKPQLDGLRDLRSSQIPAVAELPDRLCHGRFLKARIVWPC